MSDVRGMDIAGIRHLASVLQHGSDAVGDAINRARSIVESLNWRGQDRDRFVAEWQMTHTPNLMGLSEHLRQAAHDAQERATAQEQASRSELE